MHVFSLPCQRFIITYSKKPSIPRVVCFTSGQWPSTAAEKPFNVSRLHVQSEEHPLGLVELTPSIDSQRSCTPFVKNKI